MDPRIDIKFWRAIRITLGALIFVLGLAFIWISIHNFFEMDNLVTFVYGILLVITSIGIFRARNWSRLLASGLALFYIPYYLTNVKSYLIYFCGNKNPWPDSLEGKMLADLMFGHILDAVSYSIIALCIAFLFLCPKMREQFRK